MIFSSIEKAEIDKWRNGLLGEILLRISIRDDDAGDRINSFCTELADNVPELTLQNVKKENSLLSGIIIGSNITYHALPLSKELTPFLNALSSSISLTEEISSELRLALATVTTPALLKIYISPHCPFCPQAVTRCLALAMVNPRIELTVIDGNLFPEISTQDNIRSVPTLILDDNLRWTGSIDLEELIGVIAERDHILPGAETLKNIIHDGRAEEVAEMMVVRGEIFPSFFELLTDDKWTVRLGAMAAYEYLIEKSHDLCHRVNVDLCKRFPDLEDPIQGDIIYLLGESGDQSIVSFLKSIVDGSFSRELMEAAMDALDNFK